MKKIISWNVASVRARLPLLTEVLKEQNPDIVLLQETKTLQEQFPFFELKAAGYEAALAPQKSYNGVAILSKEPLSEIKTDFPDMPLEEARFIQATFPDKTLLISVYVPNGAAPMKDPFNPERLNYKLAWMEAFNRYMETLLSQGKKLILGGDFNVIYEDTDVYNPEVFKDSPLMVAPVRERFKKLSELPLVNTVRHFHPEAGLYSFWDFQGGALFKNHGILLDAIFVNQGTPLESAEVLDKIRRLPKSSDHAPLLCILK